MKIYILNGPPSSGKDTAGDVLADVLVSDYGFTTATLKAASPLYNTIPILFGIPFNVWEDMYANHKNVPSSLLGGKSPRQTMIWLSEDAVKPAFGSDHFGRVLGRAFDHASKECGACVVTDAGFSVEINAALDEYDFNCRFTNDVKLIRMVREGTSYVGDSREYIDPSDIRIDPSNYYALHNNTLSKKVLAEDIREMLKLLEESN